MQLVGYEPSAGEPAILVAEGGAVSRQPLEPGTNLSYRLSERRCAGLLDRSERRHDACERPRSPYCDLHQQTWVCARCTGTCLKDEMDCYERHAVYLAAFAPRTFKVGVTRLERLETRLREQGADRGAHIHTVSNGRIARELEAELATEHTDRVGTGTKIAGLGDRVDVDAWRSVLNGHDVHERFQFEYGLDLERQPVAETVASGTVRGVKGRILVLDRAGTSYAVDLRDLVGFEVTDGDDGRRLQSSLGAFED